MNDKATHVSFVELAVEARLAQLDDMVLAWQPEDVARESLHAELAEQVRRLEDEAMARQFMGVCPVPGANQDDYRNAWLGAAETPDDSGAPGAVSHRAIVADASAGRRGGDAPARA
ncbi:MAG: hypothetical protein R6W77_03940 [Trueperaceae bacterium]